MQKILLTLCTVTLFLFVQPNAYAQEQSSSFKRNLIGGSFSFGSSTLKGSAVPNGEEQKTTFFTFMPTYAYYIKAHVAIGANLGFTSAKYTNPSNGWDEQKQRFYDFAPFIRFEIPLWQSRFSIFNDLAVYANYSKSTYKMTGSGVETLADGWGAGAYYEPGLMFRIKSNIALQASLGRLIGYNYNRTDNSEIHGFGFRGSHSGTDDFKIGINFLF